MKHLFIILLTFTTLFHQAAAQADETENKFLVKPYLQQVTKTTAVVLFHLNKPMKAKVDVFNFKEKLLNTFSDDGETKDHFIEIDGLEEGKVYRYEVVCGDGLIRTPVGDPNFQIRTACSKGETFSFAVYGDPRPGDNKTPIYHSKIIQQVCLHEPSFAVVLGDMVDDGTSDELWHQFYEVEADLLKKTPLYPVIGDNDYAAGKGLCKKYFPILDKGFYSFEWGGVKFFSLNAWGSSGQQSEKQLDEKSEQYKWLEAELASKEVQDAPFRVVFIHDPIYISHGRSADILRRKWAPLFEKQRVDIVFSSWHLYERSRHNGVRYIVSGGGGAELIFNKPNPAYRSEKAAFRYHFCKVSVSGDVMTLSAVADDGTVFDSFMMVPRPIKEKEMNRLKKIARSLRRDYTFTGGPGDPEVALYLFSRKCNYCDKLIHNILPEIAKKYKVKLKVYYYDLDNRTTYDLLTAIESDFGMHGADVPAIFIGRTVFGGESSIERGLKDELMKFRKNPFLYRQDSIEPFQRSRDIKELQVSKFKKLTLAIILGGGLLDGINPCAFTTIIFLLSYLSLAGSTRKQMVITGSLFTLAVFITYTAIGLLLFYVASWIASQNILAYIMNLSIFIFVAILAIFSFVDFIKCLRGKSAEITLQLPNFIKKRIRSDIRKFARFQIGVASSAFVLGVVIAGLELACTGQVYLPIVTMISEPKFRGTALIYLLVYNLAFIVPLIAVFLVALVGVTSEQLSKIFKKNIALVKLGMTSLFICMGILIFIYKLWR